MAEYHCTVNVPLAKPTVAFYLTNSAGASLNKAPELQQLTLGILATFFSPHPLLNNDRLLVVTIHEIHSYRPFT